MHTWFTRSNLRRLPLLLVPLSIPFIAAAAGQPAAAPAASADYAHQPNHNLTLSERVKRATSQFLNFNDAVDPNFGGYNLSTPCVSGPDFGAMGIHVINQKILDKAQLNAEYPTALIYEPQANGYKRLVGVEFIVRDADWQKAHPQGPAQPDLEGNLLNFVPKGNRFGLPDFWEIHVWAWEDNPVGVFADWNTRVTCNKPRTN